MANVAIVQDGFDKDDALSTLKLVTKPIPKPAPGHIVVHVKLRPINPADFITLRSGASAKGGVAGSEGYGIVHEVGEGVMTLQKGQRVVPIIAEESQSGNGSFQKFVSIPADFVWAVPDWISDEAAAQFVINPWTSHSLLKDLQAPKGEWVVQSAANSTLGKQVISLAKHAGIKTINIVRRTEAKAELLSLGADEVIVSSSEDVVARVKEITGGKFAWGALDPVGGVTTGTMAACVRDGGQVFVYGVLSGFSATVGIADLLRGVSVTGWKVYTKVMNAAKKCQSLAAEVAPLVRDGVIPVAEVEVYEMAEFVKAMAKAEAPARSGKVMLASA